MQDQQADLDEFFAHKNHAYPVSLFVYWKLSKSDKSDFLNCLQEIQEPSSDTPKDLEVIVIDEAALVHMNPPKHSKTFGEYCESELGEKLKRVAVPVNQINLVFDVYREDSLMAEMQEGRGNAFRISMNDSTLIYSDFKKFLRYNDNKVKSFLLITDKVPILTQIISATVISTKQSEVTSNSKNNLSPSLPCNHEEADIRIFVHVSHAAKMV